MKQTRLPYYLLAFAAVLFLGQGCVPRPAPEAPLPPLPGDVPAPTSEEPRLEPNDVPPPATDEPRELPSSSDNDSFGITIQSSYEDFTEAKFQEALAQGRPIYLFFYANWCPTCKEQDPRNQRVVPEHPGGILGLRIHTLDNEAGDVEKRYADQYNVFVQHTGIFFKDGKEVFRRIGTQSDAALRTDLDAISQ